MGIEALAFVMDALITACCMYIASKMSFVVADFKSLLTIAVIVALVSLIPTVGWVSRADTVCISTREGNAFKYW